MSVSNEELVTKMNEVMSELQEAETTVVEATKKLIQHNEDPSAHPNLISGIDSEIMIARLSEQMIILMDRVLYLEKREIKMSEEMEVLKRIIATNMDKIQITPDDIEALSLYKYINTPITYYGDK